MKRTLAMTAALLCLSACGGQDPPSADPTRPTAPPATTKQASASGQAAPTMPAAARRPTKAGAIAFAKYYWKVVDYAQRTGDTRLLRHLEAPGCAPCQGGREWIDKIDRRGGQIAGGHHEVVQAQAPFFNGRSVGLSLRFRTTTQIVSGAGSLDAHYQGGGEWITMAVSLRGGVWRVGGWKVQH